MGKHVKIVAFSDTHSLHYKMKHSIPPCDILVCAGDFTNVGSIDDITKFNRFIKKLSYSHFVCVPGNHDLLFQRHSQLAEEVLLEDLPNAYYLHDKAVELEGIKFYGSGWAPTFMNWAFMLDRGKKIAQAWDMIPQDTDVLVTHGPPHKILDIVKYDNFEAGCEELRKKVFEIKPKLHIFGHLHHGHGIHEENGIKFVNASICTEEYKPINKPIVIDYPVED